MKKKIHDAFGKFGALDHNDEWVQEAQGYYFGIVGKYDVQLQVLFNELANYQNKKICSLHGPIVEENLAEALYLYKKWANYESEIDGVFIPYTSVYLSLKKSYLRLKNN